METMYGSEAVQHNFINKLRQPSLLPRVLDYVKWQRELRGAQREGRFLPAMPEVAPISINLDLTTACNYACPHCIDLEALNQPVRYEYNELLDSLRNLAERGLKSVILIGGGEPTVHVKFRETVAFLKDLKLQVAIVSNGSRNDVIYDVFDRLEQGDWVRLSLDAATDQTFQAMHKPKRPITLDQICEWVPRWHEKNPAPSVGFSFIITWQGATQHDASIVQNIEEIVEATERARRYWFNYISFKPFLTRHPEGSEVMDPAVMTHFEQTLIRIGERITQAKELETAFFKVVESVNLRVLLQGTWREYTRQPHVCHKQFFQQVLSPLGLFNCPGYRGVEKARIAGKDAYATPGSFAETSRATAAILERFDAMVKCANVTCNYNGLNRWLEQAIEDQLPTEMQGALGERFDYYF